MQSYVSYLQGLYQQLLTEAVDLFPTLRKDFMRDETRLLSLIESRGLPFLMIDLPTMGKHLDRCLSDGLLSASGTPGFGVYRRGGPIPRLFKGLWLRVFDDSGCLLVDPDVQAIRLLRQLCLLAKKFDMPCSESSNWKSINDFFKIDREVRRATLLWDDDDLGISNVRNLHFGDSSTNAPLSLSLLRAESPIPDFGLDFDATECLQATCDIIAASIGRFEPSDRGCKHGPGAVADQRHTQYKYDFPNWSTKLDAVFPMSRFAFANYGQWLDHIDGTVSDSSILRDHEPPSKLIVVPKTLKGPRLIAAEPVSHQWAQQNLLRFFAERVKGTFLSSCIDFSTQGHNGTLALKASHTGSHLTMDLSSASDRLSCWLVERVFRSSPTILEALHASRTRWVSNHIDRKSPQYSRIAKFACMGSACTFPVQSIVFASISIAVLHYIRGVKPTVKSVRRFAKEVRVFGDDIIVPIACSGVIQGFMAHLGLEVNQGKTFETGKFRESCGTDAYDGHDVTPVYIRAYPEWSRPESIASVVASHNNFKVKGYDRMAAYLKSTVPERRLTPIPEVPIGSGSFGYYSYDVRLPPRKRWNAFLHRTEYLVTQLIAKSASILSEGNSTLLQFFTVTHDPVEFLLGERLGVAQRPRTMLRPRWVEERSLK